VCTIPPRKKVEEVSVFDLKMKADTSQIKTMIQPLSGMLYRVNK